MALMLATVWLLLTSSVAVFPVSVFTKICISPELGDRSPEEWGFGGAGGVGWRSSGIARQQQASSSSVSAAAL